MLPPLPIFNMTYLTVYKVVYIATLVLKVSYLLLYRCDPLIPNAGFPPGMFERGGPKGVGVWGSSPWRKKSRVFKFWCLKWPILTEMTVKYGKYFNFSCRQVGDNPPCGAEWESGPLPPGGNPAM